MLDLLILKRYIAPHSPLLNAAQDFDNQGVGNNDSQPPLAPEDKRKPDLDGKNRAHVP